MKKRIVFILLTLALLLCLCPAFTSADTSGQCGPDLHWTFDKGTGTLTITGTGYMYDLGTFDQSGWYSLRDQITRIVLPDGLTRIGNRTFRELSHVATITLPQSVKYIGESAFESCKALTSINLPESITFIGFSAFSHCSSLTSITLPEGLTAVKSGTFKNCYNLKTVILPTSITIIESSAFYDCFELSDLTLPAGVTDIWQCAFSGCRSLTSINLPEGLTRIDFEAFYLCSGLTGIDLPEGITSIEHDTFYGCSRLTSVTLPRSLASIGDNAFHGCSGLTGIDLPEGLTKIGSHAFSGCTGLTSVVLPDPVTYLGSMAFYGCTALTDVTLPRGLTTIQDRAFMNCSSLVDLTFLEGLVTIEHDAFTNCTGLTSLTIPNGVVNIASHAFQDCSQLQDISLPGSVTNIQTDAFEGTAFWNSQPDGPVYLCNVLLAIKDKDAFTDATLSVAAGTKVIAGYLAQGNATLKTLVLPEGLTHIGSNAFSYCDNLTSASLPDSLTTIYGAAFYFCKKLTDVNMPGGLRTMGSSAFAYCAMTSIILPEGLTAVGNDAFQYCEELKTVTLPSTLASVGAYAFNNTSIQHVYYNGTKAMRQQISFAWDNTQLTGAIWHYSLIDVDAATFPNDDFRSWILTNLPVNGNEIEGYTMTAAQIAAVTAIDVSDMALTDITGIGEFTELASLDCSGNQLTALDLKRNTRLKTLRCSQNQFYSLDLTNCTELEILDCSNDQIRYLRIRGLLLLKEVYCQNNTIFELAFNGSLLERIDCSGNYISKLDLSGLPALATLNCSNNALPSLDVSQNPNLETLSCGGQQTTSQAITHGAAGYLFNMAAFAGDPSRVTMVTEGVDYDPLTGRLCIETQPVSFAYLYAVKDQQMDVTVPIFDYVERYLEIDEVNFPDEIFRAYICSYLTTSGDDVIGRFMNRYQVSAVRRIVCPGKGIRSLQGIEWFTALQELNVGCAENGNDVSLNYISSLDLSANTKLTKLNCSANPLTVLLLPQNSSLQRLNLSYCPIGSLDLSGLNTLTILECAGCQLTSLNVRNLSNLAALECSYNRLTSLNVSGNKELQVLFCDGNLLSKLDVSKNTLLYQLSCSNNALSTLTVSAQKELEYLDCSFNAISSLSVSSNNKLQYLLCSGNQLKSLKVDKNVDLIDLVCDNNLLTSLSLTNNKSLGNLSCRGNQIKTLNLMANEKLGELDCSFNLLESLDLTKNEKIITVLCSGNKLTQLMLPDSGRFYTLDCSGNQLENLDISLCYWLQELYCSGNRLTTLDVSNIGTLLVLDCRDNRLTSLDASRFRFLTTLACSGNQLAALDLSACNALEDVQCGGQILPRQQLTETETSLTFDLSMLIPDTTRATVITDSVIYDPTEGIVTFTELMDSFDYQYDTGRGLMSVNVPVKSSRPLPPVIIEQPQDVTVKSGATAIFAVTAEGEGNITYQWYARVSEAEAWVTIEGATQATYTIVGTRENNGWQFRCLARNEAGEAYSDAATLTVTLEPPVIKTQPKDATAKAGAKAKISVKAAGKNLTYQWFGRSVPTAGWTEIEGATAATYTFEAWMINDGWQYYCRVQNDDGAVDSDVATLTVTPVPASIKTEPKDATVKSGAKAKFSVKAQGPSLQYQWLTRASESEPWEEIPGAVKADWTVVASMAKSGSQYKCRVWNEDDAMETRAATLTVTPVPASIKTEPKDATVKSGAKAKFSVKAQGPSLQYQWYERASAGDPWTKIEGAVKAEYSFKTSMAKDGCQYQCKVWNEDDAMETRAATLTVTPVPPKFGTHPKDAKVKLGEEAKFKVKASGGTVTYQWYYRTSEDGEWKVMSGETGTILIVVAEEGNIGWQFLCRATNEEGSTDSKIATLKLK